MAVVRIDVDHQRFVRPNGRPFFILGVNYEGYFDRAWQIWEDGKFDLALIERDFRKMAAAGFNSVRLFVQDALVRDIRQGNFGKLDQVLQLAERHKLLVLVTLNDMHWLDLARTSALDAGISAHYKGASMILGWDLENEPVFYNLVAAKYPAGFEAPVQSAILVDHYGERVSRQEALDLQGQRRIPGHLSPELAYFYINALRLFLEYNRDASAWIRQRGGTLLDYMLSADATPWHKLISVLDGTVAAWLLARSESVRESDPTHPVTVGWSWPHFAGLPSNRALDFQQYHEYVPLSMAGLREATQILAGLQRNFPHHPIILGEFGWSNQSSRDPAASQAVDEQTTALFEAALLSFLRAEGFAGGMKWMLNDVDTRANPYEASFGVFRLGDVPKPIRDLVQRFSQAWAEPDGPGAINLVRDAERLAYRLTLPGQVTLGGSNYQDDTFEWRAQEGRIAHCFITHGDADLRLDATGSGQLTLEPWEIVPNWDRSREAVLFRMFGDQRSRQESFPANQSVSWAVVAGAQYALEMGATGPLPPTGEDGQAIEPGPGEHVLLLAGANDYLEPAIRYIRRFAPDLSFAVGEVAGRWPYVTVVAREDEIPDSVIEEIRGSGAQLVERVAGETPEATRGILDDLAARQQRFLTGAVDEPPDQPPGDGEEPPPDSETWETYTVEAGDTLSSIARKVYGQARLWPVIFEANRDVLADPGRIRPGMILKIPPKE